MAPLSSRNAYAFFIEGVRSSTVIFILTKFGHLKNNSDFGKKFQMIIASLPNDYCTLIRNSSEPTKRPETVLIYQIKWYKTPRDSIQSSLPFLGSHFWPLKVLVHGSASFLTLQSLITCFLKNIRLIFRMIFVSKINPFCAKRL